MTRKLLEWAVLCVGLAQAFGQSTAHPETQGAEGRVQLALSVEVATTNDEGYPTALRIMLKNVGMEAVDLPLRPSACEDGGMGIDKMWRADPPSHVGMGWGGGCGSGDMPSLKVRVRENYIRLRPREYFVYTLDVRFLSAGMAPGTVEYWAAFTPPTATRDEVAQLAAEGFIIPTREVESAHLSFHVR